MAVGTSVAEGDPRRVVAAPLPVPLASPTAAIPAHAIPAPRPVRMSSARAESPASPSFLRQAFARLRADRLSMASAGVLLLLVALAASADLLAQFAFKVGPTEQNLLRAYARPELQSPALWLGADELGRSQIVRLVYAGRVSLAVGFGAALVNLTLGVLLGLLAGYFRGAVDDVVQWLVTTIRSVPSLFLLLTVSVLFTPGTWTLVALLGLLSWQSTALFVRGQVLALREREFVLAARTLGASHARIIGRHLLPNVLPFAATLAAIDVGAAILAESALSFLGLGVIPPTPSWGNMLTNAAASLSRGPWLVWGPGGAIFATVMTLYLLGDGMRDALDPRLQRVESANGAVGAAADRRRSVRKPRSAD